MPEDGDDDEGDDERQDGVQDMPSGLSRRETGLAELCLHVKLSN